MRKVLLLTVAWAAVSTSAIAATDPGRGRVAVSGDGTVTVAADVCAQVRSLPPVAGAAYVPGVDVDGKAVAPADLPSEAPPVTVENIPIEIDRNLQRRFAIPAGARLFTQKAQIGTVTLRDGVAYFNGQPLVPAEQAALQAGCATPGH